MFINKKMKHIVLIFVLVLASNLGFSQTEELKITFLGNAGLHLTDGNTNIYVDFPYKSGAHKYMEYDKSVLDSISDNAIFLFTHKHSDHYSKKLLKTLNGKKYGNWNAPKLKELTATIEDFTIEAFKTSHKFTLKHYSYLITWHGKKIYINGDTGDFKPLKKIKDLDWVFAPYWLYNNAKEVEFEIDSKMMGLYHIAPIQIEGIDKSKYPENFYFLTKQNATISIPY